MYCSRQLSAPPPLQPSSLLSTVERALQRGSARELTRVTLSVRRFQRPSNA